MEGFISWLSCNTTSLALVTTTTASVAISYVWYKRMREQQQQKLRPTRLVVITGCDSGLGLSMALWARELGYVVLAGCLVPDGEGANMLRKAGISVTALDLTNENSIHDFGITCSQFMEETGTKLWAVISNAGVLICAEFLWQTQSQWERQFQVNFWGAVNLMKEFKSLLYEYQCRFIIISSDCSKLSLPGLSIYAGSKAALEAWGRGIRLELGKYGVTVVSYQPGAFAFASQIFAGNAAHYEEMEKNMSEIDKEFYDDYFLGWKRRKVQHSENLPRIQQLESKRHKQDLKRLLEKDLKRTPVVTYETWVQLALLWGERYLPRTLSDKLLIFVMNGAPDVQWKRKNYSKIVRKFSK